jgi:hypothetical protein
MNNTESILPDEIKDLLDKYYNGRTTLQEEKVLKKYYSENQVPLSQSSDQKILSFSKSEEVDFIPNKEIWEGINRSETKRKRFIKIIRISSSAAASLVLVIICSWYLTSNDKHKNLTKDTYSNPTEAYQAVQKYLGFTSSKLAMAYHEVKPIERLILPCDAMQSLMKFDKNMQYLNQLDRINTSTKELGRFSMIIDMLKPDNN